MNNIFITLCDGVKVFRVNVNHIVAYYDARTGTSCHGVVNLDNDTTLYVKESAATIDEIIYAALNSKN